jgi:hypothetical protein
MRFILIVAVSLMFGVAIGGAVSVGVADAQQKPKCADCY